MLLVGIWGVIASPAVSLGVGIIVLVSLIQCGFHRDGKGAVTRRRLASVFGLSVSTYTFSVCAASQLVFGGPTVGTLVDQGFGSERIAWLLAVLIVDQLFRVWDEFRPI